MAVAAENWIESSRVDSWQMMEESSEFSSLLEIGSEVKALCLL
jgi:hypothetical protein